MNTPFPIEGHGPWKTCAGGPTFDRCLRVAIGRPSGWIALDGASKLEQAGGAFGPSQSPHRIARFRFAGRTAPHPEQQLV